MENTSQLLDVKKFLPVASVAAGSTAAVAFAVQPASAAPPDLTDITGTVTALGGIATAAVAVVLGAMGARIAIKLINRVTVKG